MGDKLGHWASDVARHRAEIGLVMVHPYGLFLNHSPKRLNNQTPLSGFLFCHHTNKNVEISHQGFNFIRPLPAGWGFDSGATQGTGIICF